jgi:hypothetical protein
MKLRARLWLLPALYVCAAGADGSGQHTLDVAAEAAIVIVGPQPPARHFLELPSLDYAFRVEARCHGDWKPESLSLSVADSRVTRTGKDIEDNAEQRLELKVPAKQLAPIAMRDFCVIGSAAEGSTAEAGTPDENGGAARLAGEMSVSAVLSAHASLRCSLGDEQKILYVSQPLDITLICGTPVSWLRQP